MFSIDFRKTGVVLPCPSSEAGPRQGLSPSRIPLELIYGGRLTLSMVVRLYDPIDLSVMYSNDISFGE